MDRSQSWLVPVAFLGLVAVANSQSVLRDFHPGGDSQVSAFFDCGDGHALFAAGEGGTLVWRSDGTDSGTILQFEAPGTVFQVVQDDSRTLWIGLDAAGNPGVWTRRDGVTSRLHEGQVGQLISLGDAWFGTALTEAPFAAVRALIRLGDDPADVETVTDFNGALASHGPWRRGESLELFSLRDGRTDLWRVDADGNVEQVPDLLPAQFSPPLAVTTCGDVLLCDVRDPIGVTHVVASAGAPGDALSIASVWQALLGPMEFARLGSHTVFGIGPQMFRTDGSVSGTVRLFESVDNMPWEFPRDFVATSEHVYFLSQRIDPGFPAGRVWRTDANVGSPELVLDVPWAALDPMLTLGGNDRLLLVTDFDHESGQSLVSIRAAAHEELANGLVISSLRSSVVIGRHAFFVASDPLLGFEPWTFDVSDVEASRSRSTLAGCAADEADTPSLCALGDPIIGNADFAFEFDSATPGPSTLWLGSSAVANAALSPCPLVTDGFTALPLPGSANTTVSVPIPSAPEILGLEVFGQALQVEPGGPLLGVGVSSNVWYLLVGSP